MATYSPRRVRDEEERAMYSSEYIQLDKGEKFVGYALFNGDPKQEEPGCYEYWEHYDPSMGKRGQSVPCAGEPNCPYCEDGDKPRNRAKSAWLVTQVNDKVLKEPQVMTFTMGPQVIRGLSELRQEGEAIKGRMFRVSRPEEKEYVIAPKTDKLKVADVKEHLKAAPDFEKNVGNTLKRAMERTLMSRAMADEDEDRPARASRDEDEPSEAPKGKGKAAVAEPEDEPTTAEWPDKLEDEEVTVSLVDSDGNFFTATSEDYEDTKDIYTTKGIEFDLTDLAEGQVVTVSATLDGDGDYILDGEPEVAEPTDEEQGAAAAAEAGAELPDKLEDEVFAITEINAGDQTWEVENDELGLAFTLYFLDKGPGSDTDFDEYAPGEKVKVTAEKDTEGDMVATAVPEKVADKGRKGGKAAPVGAKGGKGK